MEDIRVYTLPTCKYCKKVKELFAELKVKYNEVDVSEDVRAQQEMIELTQQTGVPVTVVGEEVVIGYDRRKLKKLLEQK